MRDARGAEVAGEVERIFLRGWLRCKARSVIFACVTSNDWDTPRDCSSTQKDENEKANQSKTNTRKDDQRFSKEPLYFTDESSSAAGGWL